MSRRSETPSKPTFHAPMRFDWTGEKLQALSQEQLLNLLENLDRQRAIGRIPEGAAEGIDQRIAALLTKPNARRRNKALAAAAAGNEAKVLP